MRRSIFYYPLTITCLIAFSFSVPGNASAGVNRWTSIGPFAADVFALAIDPSTPTILYAGTDGGGVFKSTDGGATWSAENTGLSSRFVNTLAIDPSTPTTLYAGTDGDVFKSRDEGANWSIVLATTFVRALGIDPSTTPATLYAGTFGGGVFEYKNASEGSGEFNFLGGDSGCFIGTAAYASRTAE